MNKTNKTNDAGAGLGDKSELRWLLERYFVAMDAKDSQLLRSCYAADSVVIYHRNEPREVRLENQDALVRYLTGSAAWSIPTIHALSSTHVFEAESGYRAITFAVAQLPIDGKVLVRGLRYDDSFVRGPTGWVIQTRDHRALWQYDAAQAPSTVPAHAAAKA